MRSNSKNPDHERRGHAYPLEPEIATSHALTASLFSINPQVAILAVGSIEDRSAAVDGELVVRPTMTMTLTCDHRAIDGSEGAEFLRDVKAYVETPALAL